MDYAFHVKQQANKIEELTAIVRECMKMMDEMSARIEELEKENAELKKILAQNKSVKKTSRNSDLPPLKDLQRTNNKNKKPKSNKSSGGQAGHQGHTLELVDVPDETISIFPDHCWKCGKLLSKENKVLDYSQQVFDIPPVQHVVTQYDSYRVVCDCGQCNVGLPPEHVIAKTQYGPGVRSWISYLSTYKKYLYMMIMMNI